MTAKTRRAILRFSIGAGPLALSLVLLHGQAPPPFIGQAGREAEPQMVDLNVIALDNHGQPVTDLTRDDFRITDNGKQQTIAFFRHRDESLAKPPALGPNEVSNRGRSNVPRATMILFDLLNEKFGTRGTAANRMVHDLESLESPEYIYLYCLTLDARVVPVRGLPGPEDPTPAPGAAPWTRNAKAVLDQALRSFTQVRPVDDEDPVYRTEMTYAALDIAGAELARVPGRKSLVWVTDGVPIELGPQATITGEPIDFTPQLRQMSEVFDRAQVSIYPVRQVMLGSPDSMGGPGTTGLGSIDTLDEFATLTGGRPDAGKDIGSAVRQAITDGRTSYQVGYFPGDSNWDDKFHKLRVICSRKGVRIQAKTGYYAWREPSGARTTQALNSMVSTTFDAAEIGLRGSIARTEKDARVVRLACSADAHDLTFVHQGDAYIAELRYAIIGYAPGFQPRSGPVTPLELHLNQQQYDKVLQDGLPIEENLAIAPEMTRVRLALFDRGSNTGGSVTMPVPPPPAKKPN